MNLFVAVDAHRPRRKVTVPPTARDYAKRLREFVDVDYPAAGCIRVVQDNLPTHTPGSLYEAFPAPEAHRILERLEFHYTPKHASWLNMVEIEIGVLKRQCLDRRIDDREELEREIAAWERQRNLAGAHLKWMFTTEKARAKMGRGYPRPAAAALYDGAALGNPLRAREASARSTREEAWRCWNSRASPSISARSRPLRVSILRSRPVRPLA